MRIGAHINIVRVPDACRRVDADVFPTMHSQAPNGAFKQIMTHPIDGMHKA